MSSGPSVSLDNSGDPYLEESTVCVCGCTCVYVCGGIVCLNTNVGFNALYTCNVCFVGCNGCHV